MKNIFTISLVVFAALSSCAQVVVSGNISGNVEWTNNNIYLLNGFVKVLGGSELHIQPGTIIKGDLETQGTLIIERGAKIFAEGTPAQPIVFTSNQPIGERYYGDWGGLIICGKASINVPENAGNATVNGEAIIEGGVGSVYGGGATPDDADNSGILRYVRIEYGGIAYQPNSEINGLTLGGVGSGTTIDHVQVSFCGDDAFEFFGGTVNATHLIAYRNWDDDFDTDFGYRGKIQFAISVRDPEIADQSGSNGFESDNDGQGTENTPITNAIFSNVTILGPMLNSADTLINSNYKRALHLRRSTRTSVFNSVFTGYPKGLVIDGGVTCNNAAANLLRFRNNHLSGMTVATEAASGVLNIDSLFSSGSNSSDNDIAALLFGSTNLDSPDLMPASGSPLLSGANFSDSYLSTGFTSTTYIGALGTDDWTAQWKSFTCQTNPYLAAPPAAVASIEPYTLSVYPNPANDVLTLESRSAKILEVVCYGLDGRMFATSNKVFGARAVVDVSALPCGVYLMKAALEGGNVLTSRITVSR